MSEQIQIPKWRNVGRFYKASTGKSIILEYIGASTLFMERITLPIERLLDVINEKKREGTAYILEEES